MLDIEITESNNSQLEIVLPRLYLNNKKVKLIELFGGIGSQAKAFEILAKYNPQVIFEHHKLVEFDKYCVASYNAIHNTKFFEKDITKISYDDLDIKDDGSIYILTYSFPCQDLSTAGKGKGMQKGSGTRSSLLWEVERLLLEHKEKILPQILLMENVPQVKSDKNIYNFNEWKKVLERLGYSNFVKKINAKNYGIPQSRERCFMISILGGKYYYFPPKINYNIYFEEMLEDFDKVEKRYFLSKSLIKCFLQKGGGGFNRREQFLRKFKNKQRYFFTITTTQSSATDNYILKSDEIRKNVLREKEDVKIIDILYDNIRRLTPKECIKLMGFSYKDYEKISKFTSETQMYKQAGNSIVVTVLVAIFAQFYKDIDYEKIINDYVKKEILGKG